MANFGSSVTSTSSNRIVGTAGGAISIGDCVYLASDGDWESAQSDSANTIGAVGVMNGTLGVALCTAIANGPVIIVLGGYLENTGTLEPGEAYCVSDSVAGEFVLHSGLTEDTDYVAFMGVADTASSIYLAPVNTGVVLNSV